MSNREESLMPHETTAKSCSRCNDGMPSFRVNHLCEECFAEERNVFDSECGHSCDNCGADVEPWSLSDLCDQCEWWRDQQ